MDSTSTRGRAVRDRHLTQLISHQEPPVLTVLLSNPKPTLQNVFATVNRPITPEQRIRLAPQFPLRISWASGIWQSKMTAWHYTVNKCKTLQRLRRLKAVHSNTSVTLSPVKTTQVIYVLYDIRCVNRLYVGQTMTTAFDRFTGHVRAAKRDFRTDSETDLFHKHIARAGWQHFRIFPIEHIPGTFEDKHAFRRAATPRETFWKRTLHAFAPRGFCMEGKAKKKRSTVSRSQLYSGERRVQPTMDSQTNLHEGRQFISRLPDRKVTALFKRLQNSTFSAEGLRWHTRQNLMMMYDRLTDTDNTFWNVTGAQYREMKMAILSNLPAPTSQGKRGPTQIVVVQLFLHKEMERLGLGKIVADTALWNNLVPPAIKDRICRPILSYKYAEPVSRSFCNYAGVARMSETEVNKILNAPCQCESPSFKRFQDQSCGHVITTDTSILRNARLSDLMAKGTMFRATVHKKGLREGENLLNMIAADLISALKAWRKKVGICFSQQDAQRLQPWIDAVQMTARQALNTERGLTVETPKDLPTEEDKKRLAYLQRRFVFTTIDKAGNNFCVMCKKHYIATCLRELQGGVAYKISDLPVDACIVKGLEVCKQYNIEPLDKAKVANFHIRVKLHKEPIGYRFVAGSPNAPLTPISKWLTLAFKAIMPDTVDLWSEVVANIPGAPQDGNKSWVISDSDVIKDMCIKYNKRRGDRTPVNMSTYDFTSMYTTLSLDDLKERIGSLLKEIFERRRAASRTKFLVVDVDGSYCWQTSALKGLSPKKKSFSVEQLVEMLTHLVDNTFVSFAGKLWQQIVGIPMGTNCAGFIANLYCFTYELDFLKRVVSEGRWELARQLQNCTRYIDDLFNLGIPDFDSLRYLPEGIYPKDILELNVADAGHSVPYMDIFVRQNRRRGLITNIYDKRLDNKFKDVQVIRYPHIDSCLASMAKYGIVTSQMHRFARRCSLRSDFVYNNSLVIHRMIQKGYRVSLIWSFVRKFMNQHPTLFSRDHLGIWMRRFKCKLVQLQSGTIRPGPCGQICT